MNATSRWTAPVLHGDGAVVRPLRSRDAVPLVAALSVPEVAQYLHPPPSSLDAFRRYAAWAAREHRAGRHLTLAVVPHGSVVPVGLFQIRRSGPTWAMAEWGFVLARAWWGSGLFMQTAPLVVGYAVGTLGVRRLEARAVACNGRCNAALAKLGARCEAVLAESFERQDGRLDERLWTIVARR